MIKKIAVSILETAIKFILKPFLCRVLTSFSGMLYFTIVKYINHMKNLNSKKTKELIMAILALNREKEARNFLRDLMTEKEIFELENRWKAAKMLAEKISYPKIQKETGLSTRTIARISDWLKNGKGGYKTMINKLNIHHHNSSRKRSIMTG